MTKVQERTGKSRRDRLILRERRIELGMSAQAVADALATELGLPSLSSTAIYNWENFSRHPPVDSFAAWCRVLGFKWETRIVDPRTPARLIPLKTQEAIDVAMLLDNVESDEKRAAIAKTVLALLG